MSGFFLRVIAPARPDCLAQPDLHGGRWRDGVCFFARCGSTGIDVPLPMLDEELDEPDGRAGGDDGEGKLALEKLGAAVRVVAGGGEGEHGHHQENRQCQEGDGDRADA